MALSPSHQLVCLRGYVKLLELKPRKTMAWLSDEEEVIPCDSCRQPDACAASLKDIGHKISTARRPDIGVFNDWEEEWETGMCELCIGCAKNVHEAGRQECWNRLPSVFGLPDWEELKSLDFE